MTKLNKFLCTVCVLVSSIHSVKASTTVAATISSDQVWTAANSPYIIGYNVLIEQGVSVRVEPGTTIQSTGNYRIVVDGEFSADGTYDSVIIMDKISFEFTRKAVGYDFNTSSGSHFNYCMITGTYMGVYRTIVLDNMSLLVSNCKFINCYYTIYSVNGTYDTIKIRIEKSIFEASGGNLGYPCNIMGMSTTLEMESCLVNRTYGIFVPNRTTISKCTFNDWAGSSGIRINPANKLTPGYCILKCNLFRNFKYAMVEMSLLDTFTDVEIEDNTFDTTAFIMTVNFRNGGACKPLIRNNNFLHYTQYAFKFAGGTAGQPVNFDLKENYWNTTDTTDIAAGIYDYKDDVTVSPRADFSNFLSGMSSNCEGPLSVRQPVKAGFSIYPNPASSGFGLKFENQGAKTVRIYNIMGETILELHTSEDALPVDVSSLVNGLYFVEVAGTTEKAGLQKLIINK